MAESTKAPWHLWVVGVVSLLWSAFGGYDFIMTTTQGETYFRASGFDQPMIDYFNAMPAWMYGPWAIGVWGAVLGSILLLMRRKLAAPVLALSFLGALISLVYQKVIDVPPPPPPALAMMTNIPYVIVLIAALVAWYAWAMAKRGVLR